MATTQYPKTKQIPHTPTPGRPVAAAARRNQRADRGEAHARAEQGGEARRQKLLAGAPVFSDTRLKTLRHILGSHFDRALPRLEEGVRRYDPTAPVLDDVQVLSTKLDSLRRQEAKATAAIAEQLEVAARGLAYALEQMEPSIKAAFLAGDFRFNTLADLAVFGTPEQRWLHYQTKLAETCAWASRIMGAARQWRERESKKGSGKRGRPRALRRAELVGWVGCTLAWAGIKLTCGKDGQWARTARVVYQTAGLPVPSKSFDDRLLSAEMKFLREWIPKTLARNSQQKTPRRSRVK